MNNADDHVLPLPPQPDGLAFPSTDWATGPLPDGVDHELLQTWVHDALADQPAPLGQTLAVLAVHRGRLVLEGYGPETNADTKLISWSMAKSMLQVVVGMLVLDGRLDPAAPAAVPEWAGDARSEITLDHLLQMRSGLQWNEDYVDGVASDVIQMLFGENPDMAAYASALPLAHAPDTVFNYSSGTSNIISRIVRNELGGQAAYESFLADRLFGPLRMTSAEPTFDQSGTFVGSSYVHATARDFARFGLFALRDGCWEGQRFVPTGWIDRARTTLSVEEETGNGYGDHWWTTPDGRGTFFASGYEGQRIVCVPKSDLVLVRLGKSPAELGDGWTTQVESIIAAFD